MPPLFPGINVGISPNRSARSSIDFMDRMDRMDRMDCINTLVPRERKIRSTFHRIRYHHGKYAHPFC